MIEVTSPLEALRNGSTSTALLHEAGRLAAVHVVKIMHTLHRCPEADAPRPT
jgi:hypothetical protein